VTKGERQRSGSKPSVPPEMVEAFLGSSTALLYVRLDREGRVTWAGPFLEDRGGEDIRGRDFSDLVVEGQRDRVRRLIEDDLLDDVLLRLHLARGTHSPVTVTALVRRVGDEVIIFGERPAADLEATQARLVDLNSRVSQLARENAKKSAALEKALRELREAQVMLVQQEKMASLGQMTAGIAHELNNPLAYVSNNLYMLQRDFEGLVGLVNSFGEGLGLLEEERPDLAASIVEQVQDLELTHLVARAPRLFTAVGDGVARATDLVKRLRTFARLDEEEAKSVDLNDSLRSVVEFATFLMRENETQFTAEYGELPPVYCAAGQINQAVLNVLTNAVQAAGRGGSVVLRTDVEGDAVTVTVADDGPGVPEEVMGRIFEPFFTTKPVGAGTGLGLSIAHAIVAAHDGAIELKSAPGEGAEFLIRLPLRGER